MQQWDNVDHQMIGRGLQARGGTFSVKWKVIGMIELKGEVPSSRKSQHVGTRPGRVLNV